MLRDRCSLKKKKKKHIRNEERRKGKIKHFRRYNTIQSLIFKMEKIKSKEEKNPHACMKMMKVTGNFISVSWVSKLKETARKKRRASLFELRLTMILLFEPPAKELDFKPPTRELPMKRDGKQPHSELYPQYTTSAKSLWEEGHGQVYPFYGYPHGSVRAMKLMSKAV